MVLSKWAYRAKHIPGSIRFNTPEEGLQALDKGDEIVVCCSGDNCIASIAAYTMLTANGTSTCAAMQAGYPLEGDMVE